MAVYVDDMTARLGRMTMCHMIADTTDELIAMAVAIGVKTKWLQKAGTGNEHFDICLAKRKLAVAQGAVELTQRELAMRCIERLRAAKALEAKHEGS